MKKEQVKEDGDRLAVELIKYLVETSEAWVNLNKASNSGLVMAYATGLGVSLFCGGMLKAVMEGFEPAHREGAMKFHLEQIKDLALGHDKEET